MPLHVLRRDDGEEDVARCSLVDEPQPLARPSRGGSGEPVRARVALRDAGRPALPQAQVEVRIGRERGRDPAILREPDAIHVTWILDPVDPCPNRVRALTRRRQGRDGRVVEAADLDELDVVVRLERIADTGAGYERAFGTLRMPNPAASSLPGAPTSTAERRMISNSWVASSAGATRPDPRRRSRDERRREARPVARAPALAERGCDGDRDAGRCEVDEARAARERRDGVRRSRSRRP